MIVELSCKPAKSTIIGWMSLIGYHFLVCSAYAANIHFERATYPTITSIYIVKNAPIPGEIKWIDDERIVFGGYEPGVNEPRSDGAVVAKQGVYIFDTKTAVGRRHADGVLKCFHGGFIRYEVKGQDGIPAVREGTLGQERTLESTNDRSRAVVNDLSCKQYPRESAPWIEGRLPRLLLEEHGYLDVTLPPRHWDRPVTFVRTTGEPVVLPFTQREMSFPAVNYFPHQNAYLLYDRSASEVPDRTNPSKPRLRGVSKKLYLLRPDGSHEQIDIDYHTWHRGLGKFYLARTGVVMVARARVNRSNSAHHEVFLIRGHTWQSILDGGETSNASISSDGCRLAIGMAREARPNEKPLLRVVDLCKEGNKK